MAQPLSKVSESRERPSLLTRVADAGITTEKCSFEAPETGRDGILARLGDRGTEIPEQEFATVLDRFRHDGELHRALIARDQLPAAIVDRLIRLIGNDVDLDDLLRRHAVAGSLSEPRRTARSRPVWWRSALFGGRRGT